MIKKPKTQVLVFMGAYLPGFKGGGPVTSVRNLVERLAPDIEFQVVAPDRDLFSETAYPDTPIREWTKLGKERVLYLPPSPLNILDILVTLRQTSHDVVYLNSFFSPKYTIPVLILRRLGLTQKKPVILAVRGEFAPAALDLKSRKKQIYLKVAQKLGLLRNILFHATNPLEEERIQAILGTKIQTYLAPPLSKLSEASNQKIRQRTGPLKIVFLGRIAPMKNLDYALEVLAKVSQTIEFTIYGPLEDEQYWNLCQGLIARLPVHIAVNYAGSIAPADVQDTLTQYDLFFLPTRGENFGHVIAEALAAGCPVLISDQTPWDDLEVNGCGWALPLNQASEFVKIIERLGQLNAVELNRINKNIVQYISKKENDLVSIEQYQFLFSQEINK